MAESIPETTKIDPRVYIAMYFFRWKTITVCFLWCLLAGVLFILFAPKQYLTEATVMIWRDPLLKVSSHAGQWGEMRRHIWLLTGPELRDKTIEK